MEMVASRSSYNINSFKYLKLICKKKTLGQLSIVICICDKRTEFDDVLAIVFTGNSAPS
jgi:hypothetical protein